MKLKHLLLGGAVALCAVAALAQPVIPQVQSITSRDLIQIIPNGAPSAQSVYASSTLLGNYSASLAGNNPENALIGGDASTNLWQRATTGSSVTTTFTYGGPDRWGYWSGASTAMTVSRTSTAADLPSGLNYQYGFKMARTAAQTGVVQMCMLQAVESVNSYQFSGQTAEIDFHASAGATFSAASSAMTVYLVTGTGTDEGAAKAAYTINAGGGGGSAWAGGVATGVPVTIGTSNQRYTVAIPVPSGTTELAVALCYTPVGTAGASDYIAFSGVQLTRNSALTSVAGTAGAALNPNDTRAKAFARRSQAQETALQQRYAWTIVEPASNVCQAAGYSSSTTAARVTIKTPTTMRTAPTVTSIGTALSATTWQVQDAATPIVLSTPFLATYTANTVDQINLTATTGASQTAGRGVLLCGAGGGGILLANAEL